MKTSVLKLDNFIEDILNYSRNARQEITCETINAEELIREIWVSHKFTEGVKNIALKIDVIKQHSFNSDKRRVLIIINNLISNAIKYRDAAKQKSFVHITIDISNGVANITIADNGIGIFKNKQEKIFDMFYRATTVSTGTGIGLYIVKQTLEKLEGSVQVESEPGTGTTISISIPDKTFNYNRLQ
jgi:signal transduction histidine kinase